MHTVSFSINYWSKGTVQSLFLRHEGYLGAIGAFLKGAEQCGKHNYKFPILYFSIFEVAQMTNFSDSAIKTIGNHVNLHSQIEGLF